MSANLLPSSPAVNAPVAPVAPVNQESSKHFFLPFLWFRHSEVALCQHEHRDLEGAKTCLDNKKLAFDEMLKDPNLPRKLQRHYQNAIFSVREVVIRLTWSVHSQFNHQLDNSVKPHWQNKFADLQTLPIVGFSDAPISELVDIINCFHDQPRRSSKYRKATQVFNLGDFITYKHPTYLVALTSEANQSCPVGKVG